MESKVNARRRAFAAALVNAGIDLDKDFFALDFSQIHTVDEIRKSFNYSGKNYLGRSPARQFYYSAQNAK